MNKKDEAVEKTELVIKAFDHALTFSLDINKKGDVKKILEDLDPEHASDEEVETFMKLLKDTDTFIGMQAAKKESEKEDLPN